MTQQKQPVRALILNDTRRETGHLGCQAVMQSIFTLCEKHNIEIVYSLHSIEPVFDRELFISFF